MIIPRDWRRPEIERAYNLFWCDACAFGALHPRPAPVEVGEFYDIVTYYTHEPGAAGEGPAAATFGLRLLGRLAWQFDAGTPIDAAAVRRWTGGRNLRICDLGCGNGFLLRQLVDDGHDGVGVEPDEQARDQARARGLRVLNGTAERLPSDLPQGSFDLVIMQHVLEHCIDPAVAIGNAAALLTGGGLLAVEVPNNAAIGLARAGPCWHWLDVPRHLNFFTERSLVRLCKSTGLAVGQVEHVGYMRQFTGEWIETEQRIFDCFVAAGVIPRSRRNSTGRAWPLLARTAMTSPQRKYDSVRVVASRGEPGRQGR